jgi:DinB family protein
MCPTSMAAPERPLSSEHDPYYAKYIVLVPDDELDIVHHLADQHHETVGMLRKSKAKGDHAYGPGKWTVKEVIGHLCDTERIFAYRALRIARADKTDLPGFDENAYAAASNASSRTMDELIEELWAVRAATLSLAKSLGRDALTRQGMANGSAISVRALLYITAGHERHHVGILKERYGL